MVSPSPGDPMQPDMLKSTRHSKITGDFGEALVLYWLSKHGFECARIDHTGIDLIARNPHTNEVMGISVKSRSRSPGTEKSSIRIKPDSFEKAQQACTAFGCVPYFAIVIDTGNLIRCLVTTMRHVQELFPTPGGGANWKMRPKHLEKLLADPEVITFEFEPATPRWWKSE
jgi:Holliday junction resolvase-like predicted endonuclease